jgi:hypothetical protein
MTKKLGKILEHLKEKILDPEPESGATTLPLSAFELSC